MPSEQISLRKERSRRLNALTEKIRLYDPHFDGSELRQAMQWSDQRFRSSKKHIVKDEFSDPLLIAERLVDFAKADRETLLASVLYPSVRSIAGNGIDRSALNEIEEDFGAGTRMLVENTLRLRSLDYLPLEKGANQSSGEHLRHFWLMVLWMSPDSRAHLIRGTQFALNLEMFDTTPSRREKEDLVWRADNIVAPVMYLASYEKLRQAIIDRSYFLDNPVEYTETKKILNRAGVRKQAEWEEARQKVTNLLVKHTHLRPNDFQIELRPKSPASARNKAKRKGQTIEALGDKLAFRIIVKAETYGEGKTGTQSPEALCSKIYSVLSRNFGRGNKEELKQHYADLAIRDPNRRRSKERPEPDDRYDNYYKNPKENGYRAIHDTFFVPIGSNKKWVEFEGQIVDEDSHEFNTYGRSSHYFYKTGLQAHSDVVLAWRAARQEVQIGDPPKQDYIYVYTSTHEIVQAPKGLTVQGYAKIIARIICGRDEFGTPVAAARIDNDDPFTERTGEHLYAPLEPLYNGDRVRLFGPDRRELG